MYMRTRPQLSAMYVSPLLACTRDSPLISSLIRTYVHTYVEIYIYIYVHARFHTRRERDGKAARRVFPCGERGDVDSDGKRKRDRGRKGMRR